MDRTTKILLAAIAFGLWANAAATMMPNIIRSAHALHYSAPTEIASDLAKAVMLIANGGCNNAKLC
jgi:ribose 1,5-bisphosphokinase PhnN